MATVKGPLFSLDARGQVGGAVVFGSWKGRNYVRRHSIPSNPQSVSQVGMRSMMKFLSQVWASLSTAQQAPWIEVAARTNVSPFNAFVAFDMTRWRNFLAPSANPLAPATDDVGTAPTIVVTPGVRQNVVTVGLTTINQTWCCAIFRHLETGFDSAWNNCVQVVKFMTGTEVVWIDTPLTAGVEQFYTMRLYSIMGVIGEEATEDSGEPT